MKPKSEVFNCDCLEAMKAMPDNAFDLAVCDIPYGIGVGKMAYLQEVRTMVKQKDGSRLNANRNKKGYTLKDWDDAPPTQEYFDELCRVSKEQIIFGIDYCDWQGVGSGRIKWDKRVADGMSFNRYETAYCSLIKSTITIPLLWAGMQQAKSLAEPTTQQGNKKMNEKRIHPCHKPVMLYELLLQRFAKPLDKILDTHLGGGSSRIAAYKIGYSFTGYEIDPEYYALQEKRFSLFTQQQSLFP